MCAESDDDVSPSQPRGDEAELQGIRHPQVPQSQGKTSVKPLGYLYHLPFIVDISVRLYSPFFFGPLKFFVTQNLDPTLLYYGRS
jgi:hypothetical protein